MKFVAARPYADPEKAARRMLELAKKFSKSPTLGGLSVTALYERASSTAEVQAEVERRIAAGEIIGAAGQNCTRAAHS